MHLRRIALAAALAAVVPIAAASEGQAGGGTQITACNQTVMSNASLTKNLVCQNSPGSSSALPGSPST